ncbi:MAG: hypothetical protein E7614_05665 [Ruminococcaceae bacterium]|nr:hypothetical protein [Oscillospiraceae bacterium]
MNVFSKKLLAILLTLCSIISTFVFSIASAETPILTDDSLYVISDNYIFDVTEETTLNQFTDNFNDSFPVYYENGTKLDESDYLATGCYFDIDSERYTVIITGDVDYSSAIDATDYLIIKSFFLKTLTISETQFKAADIDASGFIDSTDFLKIKSSFLRLNIIQSSKDYMSRKKLVSDAINSANKLSNLNELNTIVNATVTTDIGDFTLDGVFLGNSLNTDTPNFSFKLDAASSNVIYPITETYYGDGFLYTQDKYSKYKVKASFSEVSEYLSNYVTASPTDSDGNFVFVPHVNKEKFLGRNFPEISSIFDLIESDTEGTITNYNFKTRNLLLSKFFNSEFLESYGFENFENSKTNDIFESIVLDGTLYVNSDGYLCGISVNIHSTTKDEALSKLGVGTPKNVTVAINVLYENIGSNINVPMPSSSEYANVDNIHTRFAFSAYDNVFDIASAVSTTYKESLVIGDVQASTESVTNIKNVQNGVELYKETNTTINNKDYITKLYIGNGKYITETNRNIMSMDLDTESLSVKKTGYFSTPHYESVNNISTFESFSLTDNRDSYTLDYMMKKDYAISLLKNSELAKDSNIENEISKYSDEQFILKNASGAITFKKGTHEIIENNAKISFSLDDGKTLVYSYDFSVKSTSYNSVFVDNSLLTK